MVGLKARRITFLANVKILFGNPLLGCEERGFHDSTHQSFDVKRSHFSMLKKL